MCLHQPCIATSKCGHVRRYQALGKYWDFQVCQGLEYIGKVALLPDLCVLLGRSHKRELYVKPFNLKGKIPKVRHSKVFLKYLDMGSSWLRSLMSHRHLLCNRDLPVNLWHAFVDCSSLPSHRIVGYPPPTHTPLRELLHNKHTRNILAVPVR